MSISSILDLPWTHAYYTEGPKFVAAAPAIPGRITTGMVAYKPGGPVNISSWPDEVGTADATTAAGTGNQPFYTPSSATFNNRPVVYANIPTDNTDRRLSVTFGSSLAQPVDIVVIGRLNDIAARNFVDNDATNRFRLFSNTAGGADVTNRWRLDLGSLAATGVPGSPSDTSLHLFRLRANTTDHLFVDEVEDIVGDAGGNTLTGLTLLNNFSNSAPLSGEVAFVGVAQPTLTNAQIVDLSAWASAHYGTTDNAVPTTTTLPTGVANLALWFSADAITGKSDGDPISTWSDRSGNGRDATQATGANQPTYKTNIHNGRPVVRFDGGDSLDISAFTLGTKFSAFAVIIPRTSVSGDRFIYEQSNDTAERCYLWKRGSDGRLVFGYNDGGAFRDYTKVWSPSVGTPYIIDGTTGATNNTLGVSGTTDTSTARTGYPTSASRAARIGQAMSGAANNFSGDICELIVYADDVSSTDRTAIRNYLSDKWSVTL